MVYFTLIVFLQVMERTFRTMGLHPTYLEAFKATHEQILTGDGPISLVDRHHLALMVRENLICFQFWVPPMRKSPVSVS